MAGVESSWNDKVKNDFVVYTAIFGKYDELKDPLFPSLPCDFICFTDDLELTSNVWEVKYVDAGSGTSSFWNRKFKMLPHRYLSEYSYSLYVDGNIQLVGDPVSALVAECSDIRIAIPPHQERTCSYTELATCLDMGLITKAAEKRWMDIYKEAGFPFNQGLFENSVIFRTHQDPHVAKVMDAWWEEYRATGGRDQLSLSYMAWKHKLFIRPMKYGPRVSRKYFKIDLHLPSRQCGPVLRAMRTVELNKHLNIFYKTAYRVIGFLLQFRAWVRGKSIPAR